MSLWEQGWRMLEQAGEEPAAIVDRCFIGGCVYSDGECLILAEWESGHVPTLFIWLAIGKNRLKRFCELAPPGLQRVAFARFVRGHPVNRSYDFERLKRCVTNTSRNVADCATHSNA